jgi:hypothetical protein
MILFWPGKAQSVMPAFFSGIERAKEGLNAFLLFFQVIFTSNAMNTGANSYKKSSSVKPVDRPRPPRQC